MKFSLFCLCVVLLTSMCMGARSTCLLEGSHKKYIVYVENAEDWNSISKNALNECDVGNDANDTIEVVVSSDISFGGTSLNDVCVSNVTMQTLNVNYIVHSSTGNVFTVSGGCLRSSDKLIGLFRSASNFFILENLRFENFYVESQKQRDVSFLLALNTGLTKIRNVLFENISINADGFAENVGLIVAANSSSSISPDDYDDIDSIAFVNVKNVSLKSYSLNRVGGLVGFAQRAIAFYGDTLSLNIKRLNDYEGTESTRPYYGGVLGVAENNVFMDESYLDFDADVDSDCQENLKKNVMLALGGVAGIAENHVSLSHNKIVEKVNVNSKNIITNNARLFAGGIIGLWSSISDYSVHFKLDSNEVDFAFDFSNATDSNVVVGGVIGYAEMDGDSILLKNSTFDGDIVAKGAGIAVANVGGLLGFVGSRVVASDVLISKSFVNTKIDAAASNVRVGGIVGDDEFVNVNILDVGASGSILVTELDSSYHVLSKVYTAGLVANAVSAVIDVTNSYYAGLIDVQYLKPLKQKKIVSYVGGFAGYVYGDQLNVARSHFHGKISIDGNPDELYGGGFVGSAINMGGTYFDSCYAMGYNDSLLDVRLVSAVQGQSKIGGMAGNLNVKKYGARVLESFAQGVIVIDDSKYFNQKPYVSGLVGYSSNESYGNSIDVSNSYYVGYIDVGKNASNANIYGLYYSSYADMESAKYSYVVDFSGNASLVSNALKRERTISVVASSFSDTVNIENEQGVLFNCYINSDEFISALNIFDVWEKEKIIDVPKLSYFAGDTRPFELSRNDDDFLSENFAGQASDTTKVNPQDTAHVESPDTTKVNPQDTAHVESPDTTEVNPQDTAHVESPDTTEVDPQDTAHVESPDTTKVNPQDTAHVESPDTTKIDSTKGKPVPVFFVQNIHVWTSGSVVRVGASVRVENSYYEKYYDTERLYALLMNDKDSVVAENLLTDSFDSLDHFANYNPVEAGAYYVKVCFDLHKNKHCSDVVAKTKKFDVEEVRIGENVKSGSWVMVALDGIDDRYDLKKLNNAMYIWDELNAVGDYWQYKRISSLKNVSAGNGAWLYQDGNVSLPAKKVMSVEGDSLEWLLRNRYSGWNMVSNPYPWYVYVGAAESFTSPDDNERILWNWNSRQNSYEPVDTLSPYGAFWVNCYEDSIIQKVSSEPAFGKEPLMSYERNHKSSVKKSDKDVLKKTSLKSARENSWSLVLQLYGADGSMDKWNVVGVSSRDSYVEEPPQGFGKGVSLSLVSENKKRLAKSVYASNTGMTEYSWDVSISSQNVQKANLSVDGVENLNNLGFRAFWMLDGEVEELRSGKSVPVMLSALAKSAELRVVPGGHPVTAELNGISRLSFNKINGLLNVSFVLSAEYAGKNFVVRLFGLDGKMQMESRNEARLGLNEVSLNIPASHGVYVLCVRVKNEYRAIRVAL